MYYITCFYSDYDNVSVNKVLSRPEPFIKDADMQQGYIDMFSLLEWAHKHNIEIYEKDITNNSWVVEYIFGDSMEDEDSYISRKLQVK